MRIIVFLLCALLGACPTVKSTCEEDGDCSSGNVCAAKVCTRAELLAACETTAQCSTRETCHRGRCVPVAGALRPFDACVKMMTAMYLGTAAWESGPPALDETWETYLRAECAVAVEMVEQGALLYDPARWVDLQPFVDDPKQFLQVSPAQTLAGLRAIAGTFASSKHDGDPCVLNWGGFLPGFECGFGTGVCERRSQCPGICRTFTVKKEGDACVGEGNTDCGMLSGLACASGSCVKMSDSFAADGTPCDSARPCSALSYCSEANKCEPRPSLGGSCGGKVYCVEGLICDYETKKCVAPGATEGAECRYTCVTPLECVSGTCRAHLGVSAACGDGTSCRAELFCEKRQGEQNGYCQYRPTQGESCNPGASECMYELYCDKATSTCKAMEYACQN